MLIFIILIKNRKEEAEVPLDISIVIVINNLLILDSSWQF